MITLIGAEAALKHIESLPITSAEKENYTKFINKFPQCTFDAAEAAELDGQSLDEIARANLMCFKRIYFKNSAIFYSLPKLIHPADEIDEIWLQWINKTTVGSEYSKNTAGISKTAPFFYFVALDATTDVLLFSRGDGTDKTIYRSTYDGKTINMPQVEAHFPEENMNVAYESYSAMLADIDKIRVNNFDTKQLEVINALN